VLLNDEILREKSPVAKREAKEKKRELVEVDSSQEWDACEMPPPGGAVKKSKTCDDDKGVLKKLDEDDGEEKIEKKPEPIPKAQQDDNDLIDIMLCAICSEIMHNCIW